MEQLYLEQLQLDFYFQFKTIFLSSFTSAQPGKVRQKYFGHCLFNCCLIKNLQLIQLLNVSGQFVSVQQENVISNKCTFHLNLFTEFFNTTSPPMQPFPIPSIFDLKRLDTRNSLKDCSNVQNIHIIHFHLGVLQKYTTQRIRIHQGGCRQKQSTISLTCTLKHAHILKLGQMIEY